MALTYSTLTTAIQDWAARGDARFIAELPVMIQKAENRIALLVQLPAARKSVPANTVEGNPLLSSPTGMLATYSISFISPPTGIESPYLAFRGPDFIQEAYGPSVQGPPRFYGLFNANQYILGPTPDQAYPMAVAYMCQPPSIVGSDPSTTSWLSTNAPDALLNACLCEANVFIKADTQVKADGETAFEKSMEALKMLVEGRDTKDTYQSPNQRVAA